MILFRISIHIHFGRGSHTQWETLVMGSKYCFIILASTSATLLMIIRGFPVDLKFLFFDPGAAMRYPSLRRWFTSWVAVCSEQSVQNQLPTYANMNCREYTYAVYVKGLHRRKNHSLPAPRCIVSATLSPAVPRTAQVHLHGISSGSKHEVVESWDHRIL